MTTRMTVEELHAHLGPDYVEIDQDVTRAHAFWKLVTQLFGSQESVAILNNVAGFAIRAIQDSLIDGVILRITKLTDPAESQGGRFQNLSLEHVINTLPDDAGAELCDDLQAQLQYIQSETDDFRSIRNKLLAHRDAAYAINPEEILPGISATTIENVLQLFRDFMHAIQQRYEFEGTVYDRIELGRDGDHLLFHLLCGKQFIDLHENVELGNFTADEVLSKIKELPKREANAR